MTIKFSRRLAGLAIAFTLTGISVAAQTPSASPTAPPPLPAKAVADATAPSGWQRYQFGEAPNFSVILPGQPDASAERTNASETAIVYLYSSSNDNATYIASRLQDLGTDMESGSEARRDSVSKNYFDGFAEGFRTTMKTNNIDYELKMPAPTKVKAAGREAYQQDFTFGPLTGRGQLIFVGSSAFSVMSIWNQQTPTADHESFFSSFQLTGVPK